MAGGIVTDRGASYPGRTAAPSFALFNENDYVQLYAVTLMRNSHALTIPPMMAAITAGITT
jgi:hypothetical protein